MEIDDKSPEKRWARLQRLVKQFRATRDRQLAERARKLWLQMERWSADVQPDEPPPKIH